MIRRRKFWCNCWWLTGDWAMQQYVFQYYTEENCCATHHHMDNVENSHLNGRKNGSYEYSWYVFLQFINDKILNKSPGCNGHTRWNQCVGKSGRKCECASVCLFICREKTIVASSHPIPIPLLDIKYVYTKYSVEKGQYTNLSKFLCTRISNFIMG